MIRRSVLFFNEANPGKIKVLDRLSDEMLRVLNCFVDRLWEKQDFRSKFINFKIEDTWLSARLQQNLGKQAAEVVKSQRKRKKKTKPCVTKKSFNLDSRIVDIQKGTHFDLWFRLSSLGNKLQIKLPAKAHKHYNKFTDWSRLGSVRLIKRHEQWFVEVFFKKEIKKKAHGKTIGLDTGYKELAVTSEGQSLDLGLEQVYEKISRKKQGSKAFKRALVERNNLINQSLNQLSTLDLREIVAEDLKNVKRKSKGKISKKFNNKLQRWSYARVLTKLQYLTEEAGVLLTKVNPAYTSQKCCVCGVVHKPNRKGKVYECACGNKIDADLNAAINLSHMGVYSPHASKRNIC